MTSNQARKLTAWCAVAWATSVVLSVLFGNVFGGPPVAGDEIPPDDAPRVATALGAVLIAAATVVMMSWVTSMVAGPFVLARNPNTSRTLSYWKAVVLPLSLAVGFIAAIAFPVTWSNGCERRGAVVPFVTVPVYLLSSPGEAKFKYFGLPESDAGCGSP